MGDPGGSAAAAPRSPDVSTDFQRTRELLLVALTFAAGVVDAVSYLGLGRIFTANMTGNLVFLALGVGQRDLPTALHSVGALIGFCVGAVLAGWIFRGPRKPGPWPTVVTAVIFGELACLTAFAVGWGLERGAPTGADLYLLIGLSSLGMGFQNAAARYVAVPGLTTTVITVALTGFMVDLTALGVAGPGQRRAAVAVTALFCGAAIGAALMLAARTLAPVLTVVTVAMVALVAFVVFGVRGPTVG